MTSPQLARFVLAGLLSGLVHATGATDAKHAGDLGEASMKAMSIGWVSFEGKRFDYKPREPGEHYRLIIAAMREKLAQNPAVKKILLATGDLVLRPDHIQEPGAPAAWRYFDIWMQLRAELQHPPKN